MLRYKTGVAGSAAGGASAARYFLEETLKPENVELARYYAGETVPQPKTEADDLAFAVMGGDVLFSEALDALITAHATLHGYPDDLDTLEAKLSGQLLQAVDRADAQNAVALEGGTVARVREDLDPRLAQRLGIDMSRPITQAEIAHLLTGVRADNGQAIEGKQVQKPMRSVVEVFGLDAKALLTPEAIDRILAGRRADGADPRSAVGNGEPLSAATVEGAKKRFLAAYGLPADTELTADHVEAMKAGKTATGRFLDGADTLRKLNAVKPPVAFVDCIWSADKSVSAVWALSDSEAQRSVITQAHRAAVSTAMAYLETEIGQARKGKGGKDGVEPGTVGWITFDHYTARPTAEIATVDKDGQAYTEFQTVPMRHADPQLHSHAVLMNAVLTETGHIGSMDLDKMDGLVKRLGGVYQAALATNLRAASIDTILDPKTGAARIVDVPEHITQLFSKRSQDIQAAARSYAAEEGLDWDSLSPERQIGLLRKGVEETRQQKSREHAGENDFAIWRKQAEEVGYTQPPVIRPSHAQTLRPDDERYRVAYETSLPLIEAALGQRAKLDAGEFEEFAVRGLVQAGISNDPGKDIKAVMRMYRQHGVRQDGQMTAIRFGQDVPVRGKTRWSVTTDMHVQDETHVVALAKQLSNDTSAALTPDAIAAAQRVYLEQHPKIDPDGAQWIKQCDVARDLVTGGRFGVAVGVGGAGKSTLMSPVVTAMRADGGHIHGIARGWKQAVSLREAGVEKQDVAAVSVFLNREAKGRIKLDDKSVVVIEELSQVGRGDMLALLQLQARHNFRMFAIGDPKQGNSIEPAVIDLLVETLGDKVPQILTSVRAKTERERQISSLFREGQAAQAIQMKLEDGTAELVAGGRDATIKRVADKWMNLTTADPTLKPTIGVASNRDAHAIGVAIREQLQAAGRIKPDEFELPVLMRGETGIQSIKLAKGDQVRVFNRIWSNGHFASNGDTLQILSLSKDGMIARNEKGQEAWVPWARLQRGMEPAPRLAYGHALTIDASQGITSRVHLDAMVSGSWQQQGGKGYVNESRQTETTHMIVNEAAERRKIYAKLPYGSTERLDHSMIWKHVADNLNRPTTKATALDFMRHGTEIHRGGLAALPIALDPAERRERAGDERMTIRQRLDRSQAVQWIVEKAQLPRMRPEHRPQHEHQHGPSLRH